MTNNQLIQSVLTYFEKVKQERELTYEEAEIYVECDFRKDYAQACAITKDDLRDYIGDKADDVTPKQLDEIAWEMGNNMCESGTYWLSLEYAINYVLGED